MEVLNQFGVQPILLTAQVVNFFILLFLLKKFLYGPILKVLNERKKKIEDSLKNAEEIERKLAETNGKVETLLAKATEEGQKVIAEATAQANLIIEDAKTRAEAAAQKILEDARAQIQIEKERMRWEVQRELSKIVMLVVEKVTGRLLNQKSQKELVEKAVKEFKS